MCCNQTCRSVFRPEGRSTLIVRTGNHICSRALLLASIGIAKNCMTILEQPIHSVMMLFDRFVWWLRTYRIWRTDAIFLGLFSAPSPKPIYLWSNRPEVGRILSMTEWTSMPSHHIQLYTTHDDGRVTGRRDVLHESQAYPTSFGLAIGQIYQDTSVALRAQPVYEPTVHELVDLRRLLMTIPDDTWDEANLSQVFDYFKLVAPDVQGWWS